MDKFFSKIKDGVSGGENKAGQKLGGGGVIGAGAKKQQSNNKFELKNPFENVGKKKKAFKGGGNSLGGSKPGLVQSVSFSEPGSLGIQVEKTETGGTIVSDVVPGGQSAGLGLMRGDLICIDGIDKDSIDDEEMMFEMFMALARSEKRPFSVQIRRVKVSKEAASASSNNVVGGKGGRATDDARRRAVIAAAEAREKASKKKSAPLSRSGTTSLYKKQLNRSDVNEGLLKPDQSDDTKRLIAAAKAGEASTAHNLGYNPYATAKMSSGQAKTAVVTTTHGDLNNASEGTLPPPPPNRTSLPQPGAVLPPQLATSAEADGSEYQQQINEQFDEAFLMITTSSSIESKVKKNSLTIVRKLINNAITKGQIPGEDGEKFRRVRLSNQKIKAAIVDVQGALDLIMSCGFELVEDNNTSETVLVYPADKGVPHWISRAVANLQAYESQN